MRKGQLGVLMKQNKKNKVVLLTLYIDSPNKQTICQLFVIQNILFLGIFMFLFYKGHLFPTTLLYTSPFVSVSPPATNLSSFKSEGINPAEAWIRRNTIFFRMDKRLRNILEIIWYFDRRY